MSTGRQAFQKFNFIIKLSMVFFGFLPNGIRKIIWGLTDSYEGKVSLGVRYCLVAAGSKKCGANVYIGKGVILKNLSGLTVGDNVSIHAYSYIDAFGGIYIGDNVSIAHGCSFVSFEHTWGEESIPIKYNPINASGIHVSNDVWFGCGSKILDGSYIGERTVIAAGSVVVKGKLESKSIYGGVPARKIKNI